MSLSCRLMNALLPAAVGVLSMMLAWSVGAHGPGHHGRNEAARSGVATSSEQKPWGVAGAASAARRTIEISMSDDMRFQPAHFEVRLGETVRLAIRNRGALMHELVIGTRDELDSHAALMLKHPNMEHDEPWMAHVEPGRSGDLIWTFNRAGEFEFACLLPGHFQAGMRGTIRVR